MATERAERRLAAIMFTDIVGYTALMAESEEHNPLPTLVHSCPSLRSSFSSLK